MKLTVEQELWLEQHGGRTERDVLKDENDKLFTIMYKPPTKLNPFDYEEVYLPQ